MCNTIRSLYFIFLLMGAGLSCLVHASAPLNDDQKREFEHNATDFIVELGAQAIQSLTDNSISRKKREERFAKIFEEAFDVLSIAKFVLGRYRRQSSEEEKKAFLDLFKEAMASNYASRFQNYTNEPFKVRSARYTGDNSGRVFSVIIRPESPDVSIEWKVYRNKEGHFKIIDVIVENISMSVTNRQEYQAIIERQGGLKGLNEALKDRIQRGRIPLEGVRQNP